MTFSQPLALFGLLSLPVIVFLHILRSRSRRLPVSSMTLWKFLQPQLRGERARKLPLTWLLVLDLTIAALLSLALAEPTLPLTRTVQEARHRIFLVDTSTSMGATDIRPTRLKQALEEAGRRIVEQGEGDVATLIAFTSSAHVVGDTRVDDISTVLSRLEALQPGGRGVGLQAALALAEATRDPEIPAEIHVFSDSPTDLPPNVQVIWHLFGTANENQAVLTTEALPLSATKFQVFARFANFGDQPAERSIVVIADENRTVGNARLSLPPQSTQALSWEIQGSASAITVKFAEPDILPADDLASTAMTIPAAGATAIQIALVADDPGPLLRALSAVPGTDVQVISPDEFLPGSPYDMFVFRGTLPERWPAGTVLVVDPPPSSSLLGTVLPGEVSEPPFPVPHPLLQGVDFTGVRWQRAHFLAEAPRDFDPILTSGDRALILTGQVGLANLVVVLPEIAGENGVPGTFARHPSFPVFIANTVQSASAVQIPRWLAAGAALELPDPARYPNLSIDGPNGLPVALPDPRPRRWTLVQGPGIYELTLTDLEGRTSHHLFGVNFGDPLESDITPNLTLNESSSQTPPAGTVEAPVSLTPWLLLLVAALWVIQARVAWR